MFLELLIIYLKKLKTIIYIYNYKYFEIYTEKLNHIYIERGESIVHMSGNYNFVLKNMILINQRKSNI